MTTCKVRIFTDSHDYHGHSCGRPVVDATRELCSLHVKQLERRAAREAEWVASRDEAQAKMDRLSTLGLPHAYVTPEGEVRVAYADLVSALEAKVSQ